MNRSLFLGKFCSSWLLLIRQFGQVALSFGSGKLTQALGDRRVTPRPEERRYGWGGGAALPALGGRRITIRHSYKFSKVQTTLGSMGNQALVTRIFASFTGRGSCWRETLYWRQPDVAHQEFAPQKSSIVEILTHIRWLPKPAVSGRVKQRTILWQDVTKCLWPYQRTQVLKELRPLELKRKQPKHISLYETKRITYTY